MGVVCISGLGVVTGVRVRCVGSLLIMGIGIKELEWEKVHLHWDNDDGNWKDGMILGT